MSSEKMEKSSVEGGNLRGRKREGAHLQELTDIGSQDSQDGVISRLLAKFKEHLPKQLQDVSRVNF